MGIFSGGHAADSVRKQCVKVNHKFVIYAGPDAVERERTKREPELREILTRASAKFGESSEAAAVARYFLAMSLTRSEQFDDAEAVLRQNLALLAENGLEGGSEFVTSLNKLIDLGFAADNLDLVESVFREHAAKTKSWPKSSFNEKYFFWFRYYEYLAERERFEEAVDAYSRVYEAAEQVWGTGDEQHFIAIAVYADLLHYVGQDERARVIAKEAYEIGLKSDAVAESDLKELKEQFKL